jgi:hypothetical protein
MNFVVLSSLGPESNDKTKLGKHHHSKIDLHYIYTCSDCLLSEAPNLLRKEPYIPGAVVSDAFKGCHLFQTIESMQQMKISTLTEFIA